MCWERRPHSPLGRAAPKHDSNQFLRGVGLVSSREGPLLNVWVMCMKGQEHWFNIGRAVRW